MDLSIVIPFYNEEIGVPELARNLLPILSELSKQYKLEVILVDDGSTDGTFMSLQRAFSTRWGPQVAIRFERHPTNRGLGAALRTGFATSQGNVVLTLDSDGTYSNSELPPLLGRLNPNVDIVTASPYHPNGQVIGVSVTRAVLTRAASSIYRVLLDRRIHTYTSIFRVYRRSVVENVPFHSNGFLAGTEILAKAILLGYRVEEYPTTLKARQLGVSKARIGRMITAHLAFQFRLLLHRLRLRPLMASPSSPRGTT